MNSSCKYLKKFYSTSGGIDLKSMNNNYLIIINIQ